jgi:hypothetical protein
MRFLTGMRAHLTKLMDKFAAMVVPGQKAGGPQAAAASLRFEWRGQALKSSDTPDMVGLSDGDTIAVFVK